MDICKKKLPNQDETIAKKQKMIVLEVKFQLNVNVVIEGIADCGNVRTACHWKD